MIEPHPDTPLFLTVYLMYIHISINIYIYIYDRAAIVQHGGGWGWVVGGSDPSSLTLLMNFKGFGPTQPQQTKTLRKGSRGSGSAPPPNL